MADYTPQEAFEKCLGIIRNDAQIIERLDDYLMGHHDPVYIPDNADAEFSMIAKRAPLNMIPLVVNSVTQVCYVEGIRHASTEAKNDAEADDGELDAEMKSWQRNRMDAKQMPITRALATHGITYVLTTKSPKNDKHAVYSAFTAAQAAALFDDPVNDHDPTWGLVIKSGSVNGVKIAWLFNEENWWRVTPGSNGMNFQAKGKHGMSACPLSRGVLHMDLHGNVVGLVEPCIQPQNAINQTSFDVLTTQSYGSFKVRTATGMAMPIKRWSRAEIDFAYPVPPEGADPALTERYENRPAVGDPILDANGQEQPLPVSISQKRFLTAEDPDTKFGTLPETNVEPILKALADRVKYLAAVSQTPPTYFMGELANLSAEALQAAEVAKTRRDGEVKMALAEMYERALSLGMEIEGHITAAGDEGLEVKWADTDPRSLAAVADALGKMAEMLDVPPIALWEEIPDMTPGKLLRWKALKKEWDAMHPEVEMIQKITDMGGVEASFPAYEDDEEVSFAA